MSVCIFVLNVIIASIGAFIGVGGSLYIYKKQRNADEKKEQERQEAEQIKERDTQRAKQLNLFRYYEILLNAVVDTAKSKKACIDRYIKKQADNFAEISPIETVSDNDFDRIKRIDYSFLFDAWNDLIESEDKIMEYRELQAKLDYIEDVFFNMYSIYSENANKGFATLVNVNEILRDFVSDLNDYLNENQKIKKDDTILNELRSILNNYLQKSFESDGSQSFTLNEVRTFLLEPILKIADETPKVLSDYLLSLLGKMMSLLREVEMQTKYVLDQLSQPMGEIDKHLNDIQMFIEKVKIIR